ncbi:PREDICTED: LEAF RUST 10 DISEASE-RESISTANCE LOCUS RECEPTOR-LIKE PROTEIN KINASE-like 2.3 [Camelina sativa]|uniref:LEAF RUST 10 DISEASE-RESISTANCE LOCUS RECEPTOR-LIKE PROTEIN KINASE-like 2.3 n=1 Tax=Camelina sativa TaxID=90675 RepID=A0ABM1QHT9_CAMSA|nr:PREDICTED: LEAF RUST 10 DISEASE-RESISTANCE LOCUS RECEPTOR-LIKE PROTEIN KINASE-like 2.3 [Camelina sativa]
MRTAITNPTFLDFQDNISQVLSALLHSPPHLYLQISSRIYHLIKPSPCSTLVTHVRHFPGNFTCPVAVTGLGSLIQNSTYHKLCDESFTVTVPTSFVPEEEALNLTNLESVLRKGFEVKLKVINEIFCQECLSSGGSCGFQLSRQVCYKNVSGSRISCRTTTYISGGTNIKNSSTLIIISTVAGSILALFVVMILAFLLWERRKKNALRDQNLDMLVTLRRYSYREIKKITKSFTEVVGRGGFGTVYKGKLRDGSKVAVKVLKDSMGNCEDFINEVASMKSLFRIAFLDCTV